MTKASKTTDNDLVVQEHCIDLPGESVQCWIGGGTDKLKVVLRKHRDVIFDIHLGNGKTYTLESTESDFYNVRDKKLVFVEHSYSGQASTLYIRLSPTSGMFKNIVTIPKKSQLRS
jgi:hypothetical protein